MERHERRRNLLLLAGLLAGIGAAAVSLALPERGLPDGAVAQVGERLIWREDWLRAVAAVATERRTALTDADQRRILERLVDEELLVQHGLALGLAERDRRLRGQIVADVIAATTGTGAEPDDAALRRHFEEHREYFEVPGRVRVTAQRPDGSAAMPPVPDTLLSVAKLREYLGPSAAQAVLALAPGESAEVAYAGAPLRVRLEAREPARAPRFEDVRATVRESWLRQQDEAAVRELLAQLRDRHPVAIGSVP